MSRRADAALRSPPAALRVVLAAAAGLLAATPSPAAAGAWTLPAGTGQVIVTGTFTTSSRGYDDEGRTDEVGRYDKLEVTALAEYGLTDRFTAVVTPSFRHVDVDGPYGSRSDGPGYTDLGGRLRLAASDDAVLSVQALARVPGADEGSKSAEVGSTDPEADLRGLAGVAFDLGPWPSFLDAQLAYRVRFDEPPDEVRGDLTLGARPRPDLLLLVQSLNVVSVGPARGVFPDDTRYHKLALSAVVDVTERWALQVGGVATIAGESALLERGGFLGAWYRF